MYASYRTALAGLALVPQRLADATEDAAKEQAASVARAETSAASALKKLHATSENLSDTYGKAVEDLHREGVALPLMVRPKTGVKGTPNGLQQAVQDQRAAEAAVRTALVGLIQEKAAGTSAAEALRRRRENVEKAKAEAAAARLRLEQAAAIRAAKQKKHVLAALACAVLLTALILTFVFAT